MASGPGLTDHHAIPRSARVALSPPGGGSCLVSCVPWALLKIVSATVPATEGHHKSPANRRHARLPKRHFERTKTNVVIKLKGSTLGYVIDKCFVATDEEYAEFFMSLDRWQAALLKYYDLYE